MKGNAAPEIAKRKEYDDQINKKYDELVIYSKKAYDLYSQMSDIKGIDKVYYKEVTRDLVDYYQIKKNTAEVAKYQDKLKQLQ